MRNTTRATRGRGHTLLSDPGPPSWVLERPGSARAPSQSMRMPSHSTMGFEDFRALWILGTIMRLPKDRSP